MGLEVYLMRHGCTAWNEAGRFRGTADIPLSERGFAQAAGVGAALADTHFDLVLVSPLSRAQQTADTVLKANRPTAPERHTEPRLASLCYGAWEGLLEKDVSERDPELWARFSSPEIAQLVFPDGEKGKGASMPKAFADCAAVMRRCEAACAAAGGNLTVLLVTHQVITRTMLCYLLGMPDARGYWNIGQDLACVNVIEKKSPDSCYVVKKMNVVHYIE